MGHAQARRESNPSLFSEGRDRYRTGFALAQRGVYPCPPSSSILAPSSSP
jgi:hypothetical protein